MPDTVEGLVFISRKMAAVCQPLQQVPAIPSIIIISWWVVELISEKWTVRESNRRVVDEFRRRLCTRRSSNISRGRRNASGLSSQVRSSVLQERLRGSRFPFLRRGFSVRQALNNETRYNIIYCLGSHWMAMVERSSAPGASLKLRSKGSKTPPEPHSQIGLRLSLIHI